MSGISRNEREMVSALQEQYLANGGEIHRMPIHAPSTGTMRFSYARREYRERIEAEKAEAMQAQREQWNVSASNGEVE